MKTIRHAVILLLFAGIAVPLWAHSLWIETPSTGKIGQAQDIKLYFGEYAQHERDELTKWRSDLKDLVLWLVGPDGKKEALTISQGTNYCEAGFTPRSNGVYTLLVSHKIKDLSGTTQLEFLASTDVLVGHTVATIDRELNTNEWKVFPQTGIKWKKNTPLTIKTLFKGNGKAGNTVLVFSPSGWSQELTTAADGTVSFIPLWPGKYVLEATNYEETPGESNGNKYKAIWQGATYSFEVAK